MAIEAEGWKSLTHRERFRHEEMAMRCSSCGAENAGGIVNCGNCGKLLRGDEPGSERISHQRFCVSCGRSIDFEANACPYCGHDFRSIVDAKHDQISTNMRVLYYLLSFFVGIAGIVIGAIYMTKPDPDYKHVGKICLIIGIISTFIIPVLMAAFLYILVLRF